MFCKIASVLCFVCHLHQLPPSAIQECNASLTEEMLSVNIYSGVTGNIQNKLLVHKGAYHITAMSLVHLPSFPFCLFRVCFPVQMKMQRDYPQRLKKKKKLVVYKHFYRQGCKQKSHFIDGIPVAGNKIESSSPLHYIIFFITYQYIMFCKADMDYCQDLFHKYFLKPRLNCLLFLP